MSTGFLNVIKRSLLLDSDGVNRSGFAWIAREPEMLRRLAFTAGILLLLSFMTIIPLPGVDLTPLNTMNLGSDADKYFSSALRHRVSIMTLGILPFLSACATIQFFSIFFPALRKLGFGGEKGRLSLEKYSFIVTVVIAAFQGFLLSFMIEGFSGHGVVLAMFPGLGFRMTTALTLTAATMLLVWAAEFINRRGIGNGYAILTVASFPVLFFNAGKMLFLFGDPGQMFVMRIVLAVFFMFLLAGAFILAGRGKKLPLQDAIGRNSFLIIRPGMVGASSLAYAQGLTMLPVTMLMSFASSARARELASGWASGSVWVAAVCAFLAFALVYAYARVVFDRNYVQGLLDKYGYRITGGTTLEAALGTALLPAAVFWTAMALLPALMANLLGLPLAITGFFGGYALAMFGGALSDTLAHLAFFKEKKASGIAGWDVCYTAMDEIEAELKSGYLKSKGIPALVEPSRFSLSMPIRTVVDRYRIYVPSERRAEARPLIGQ